MISTSFVLAALLASSTTLATPLPLTRSGAIRRPGSSSSSFGAGGGSILGDILQGTIGGAAAIGAQGLENANQQAIANQQLAAASSIAAAAAAAQATPAAAKREPLRFPKLGAGAGSEILGGLAQGIVGGGATLAAQGLQNANQQDIANQQIAAATGAAAKREPLKFPKLGGGAGGSSILGDILQAGFGGAATLGAQGLENANQQDIANQQIAAATGAAAKREPLRFPKLGAGAGSEILGGLAQGIVGGGATLAAQGLQNANQQDIANQQIAAATGAAAKREPLRFPKLGGAGSEILGGLAQGIVGGGATLAAQGLQNANQQDIANQQIAAATGAAVKREPLKFPKFGGGAGGSSILGDILQAGFGGAATLGAQGLENANQQDIANQQIAAATGAAAKREPLRFPKLGGAVGSDVLGGLTQGIVHAAATLGAQGLENANQQDIANQQLAAASSIAASAQATPAPAPARRRWILEELE